MDGICRLCHSRAILRFSHIVPELCYLAAYDAKHRAQKLTSDKRRNPPIQKGIREYLLCDGCENKLSKIEGDFKNYWYGGPALPKVPALGSVVISGFNYTWFKLFHLSILWRAGVASIPEFDTVDLGPYEEKLRRMLLCGTAGPEDHYPIFATVLVSENNEVRYGLVTKPQVSRLDAARAYYLCYAGCDWYFVLSDHPHGDMLQVLSATPKKDGTMKLLAQDWKASSSVMTFVEDRSRHKR